MDKIEKWQAEIRGIDAKLDVLTKKAEAESRDFNAEEDKEVRGHIDAIKVLKHKIDTERQLTDARASVPAERLEVVQDEADQKFGSFGEYLQAVARASLPRGARLAGKPCGVLDKRLYPRMDAEIRAASGLNEAVPAEGGFLVDKDWSSVLIQKAHQTGKLPGLCNKIPIGADKNGLRAPTLDETSRATGSRLGGIRVYRKNEATAPTAAKPKFGRLEIDLEDMIGLCYVTNDLLEDHSAMGAIVENGFGQEFGFKLDDEIVNGDGAGKCQGFLASAALVTITKETGQTADTINVQNILKMDARFWESGSQRAVWLANREIKTQLYVLSLPVGTGGIPVFMPAGGLSGKPYDSLMGRPIYFIEQAAGLGDAGDISLVDFNEYVLIDKGGIVGAQSLHVNFTTNEMAFRWVYRVNGQPTWSAPLTPFKGTASTISPFVTLGARA